MHLFNHIACLGLQMINVFRVPTAEMIVSWHALQLGTILGMSDFFKHLCSLCASVQKNESNWRCESIGICNNKVWQLLQRTLQMTDAVFSTVSWLFLFSQPQTSFAPLLAAYFDLQNVEYRNPCFHPHLNSCLHPLPSSGLCSCFSLFLHLNTVVGLGDRMVVPRSQRKEEDWDVKC